MCIRDRSIRIKMTDKDVLESVADLWDAPLRGPYQNKGPALKKWKDYYQVETGKRDKIFEIVSDIYPYMGDRRKEKMDEFLSWYDNLSTQV